ncbi:MAG: hypothetical protein A2W75_07645 [Nitrospinae bacterium RIFCSPLOWO2_12_39_15]|nr:MAG: hypothetical protein A3D97_03475 [Nitrospinae bacterium RIFCSPHIGHO2_12_FULL_39_42]OGW11845.1 MAG: hypothetical protein A2W75_07645 [Nitrospinae bacterium RIFCSPLOWO2_12_39_15]
MMLFNKIAGLVAIFIMVSIGVSQAETTSEVWPSGRKGNIGVGADWNPVNFGAGPLAKYWATENIGVQGTFTALGGFTGYALRGIYGFDNELLIAGQKVTPYAGLGYASASRKDTYAGLGGSADITYSGSGIQIFGGAEGRLLNWGPNWYFTGEAIYSPLELKGSYVYETTILGTKQSLSQNVSIPYSSFGIAMSLVYYFK